MPFSVARLVSPLLIFQDLFRELSFMASHLSTEQIVEEAVQGQGHPNWVENFPESERRELMDEDLEAGRMVPLLLASIILGGVTLAAGTVLYCLYIL